MENNKLLSVLRSLTESDRKRIYNDGVSLQAFQTSNSNFNILPSLKLSGDYINIFFCSSYIFPYRC